MKHGAVLILAGLLAFVAPHQVTYAGDAGQESPFTVGVGARALGMGGGFTSIADDASAMYFNPAGLAVLEYQEVTAMHMSLLDGAIFNYGSWVYPTLSLGGFGLAYMRMGVNDIIRREGFVQTGEFDYSNSQFLLAYGRRLRGPLTAGVSLKILYQSLDVYSDWAVGLDFGMTARLHRHVSAGIIIRDMIPPTLELNTAEETLPLTVAGGLALRDIGVARDIRAQVSFELEKIENRDTRIHTGAELLFDSTYALRAGYDRDNLSFGAGFRYGRLQMDYAYKVKDYVDDSHRFSISYFLGTSISRQAEERLREEKERGSELLADERRRQFALNKERADEFYSQYRLDSALTYYQRALAFDEDNQQIIGTIAAIESARRVQRDQEQLLRERQYELNLMIETYYEQAETFYSKEYYPAALDMLDLIFEIDAGHRAARRLQEQIYDAMSREIATHLELARDARADGDAVRAIEAYQRVLYLDPDNPEALAGKKQVANTFDIARHLNTGIDLFKAGRYEAARKQFELVVSVNRNEPVAREYIDRIESALAHPPTLDEIQNDPEVWRWYLDGLRYMRNQQFRQAIDAWEKVLEAYPGNEATLNNIEQARLRLLSGEED